MSGTMSLYTITIHTMSLLTEVSDKVGKGSRSVCALGSHNRIDIPYNCLCYVMRGPRTNMSIHAMSFIGVADDMNYEFVNNYSTIDMCAESGTIDICIRALMLSITHDNVLYLSNSIAPYVYYNVAPPF